MSEEETEQKFDDMVEEESKKPQGDLFCPRCGSTRLYYFVGFQAGQIYVCKECGYQGPLVVEDGRMAEEIRKDWEKGDNED